MAAMTKCTAVFRRVAFAGALALTAVVGCSSDDKKPAAPQLAPCEAACRNAAARCSGYDAANCTQFFCMLQLPSGCLGAIDTALCTELVTVTGTWIDACLPKCAAAGTSCADAETLVSCQDTGSDFRSYAQNCTKACDARPGATKSTGLCSVSPYDAQTSPTAQPSCWCVN
jgi:hypothetical protein